MSQTAKHFDFDERDKPQVVASRHAIEQYIKRSGRKNALHKVGPQLERMVERSREVYPKDGLNNLLKYGFDEARYFLHRSWILVVVNGVITTTYQGKLRNFTGHEKFRPQEVAKTTTKKRR